VKRTNAIMVQLRQIGAWGRGGEKLIFLGPAKKEERKNKKTKKKGGKVDGLKSFLPKRPGTDDSPQRTKGKGGGR